MKNKIKTLLFMMLGVFNIAFNQTPIKILFDAKKAETAANADWVIDADLWNMTWNPGASTSSGNESNAQRYPTPSQSLITASTPETYWKGALSNWAVDCAKNGYTVETLPYNGQITYGNTSNAQDLSNYKVYIIVEPNILFTAAEKTALMQFVQNGGGLFLISDHTISDRNGDNNDSPMIWNDFITNNSVLNNGLGFSFDLANISQTSTNVITAPADSILNGTAGNVTEVKWSNGTTMTLNPTQNPSVKGVIYTTGSAHGNSNVLCAYSRVGSGKVAAIGDSSPPDDGTGDANDVLYNGYTLDAAGNHQKLLMNITIWLATSPPPPVASYTASTSPICSGQSVTFTSTSTGSPTVYAWSFPGGTPSTSSLANPVVVYNSSGVFNVTLVATNGSGSNTLTNPSSITVNSYPTIAAITGNTTICIGSTSILSETTSSGTWSSNSTAVATISSSGLVTGLTAGSSIINYYVTSNGCSSSQTSTITVNPLPVLTFSTFPIICLNGPAYSLTEGLPSGGQYTGTGITGTVFTPTIVGMTTISYTYADVNGCQSTEQTAINVNSCATIDEQAKESFTISPNPAQIEIKIQTGNEKIKQIKLFDNCGRMLQMKINYQLENQITIDLNTCINGVYYIQLFSENTVTSSKFIIDK